MKILAFTPFSSMFGGANRSFIMVLRGLKNNFGYEISVILPEDGKITEELDKLEIEWHIISSHKIRGEQGKSLKNSIKILRSTYYLFIDKWNIKHNIEAFKSKYDVIYINDSDAVAGAFFAKFLKIPYVWHFRSPIQPNYYCPYRLKKLYNNSSVIICISDAMKELLYKNRAIPTEKIKRIYNGVPFVCSEKVQVCKSDVFNIVLCGRITKEKGHIDAIKAIRILKDNGINNIVIHIVGSALGFDAEKFEEKLIHLCKEYKIEENVVFEGQQEDMDSFRNNMDCELICSVCEPFGRVTVEGMRKGLVVIGSNTGGTPEIIEDGVTGLLYQQGNADDLAKKVFSVYSNRELAEKLSLMGYKFACNHFTEEENVYRIQMELIEAYQNNIMRKTNDRK